MKPNIFTKESWMDQLGEWFVAEPNTGCWLWLRGTAFGYGQISVGGKNAFAHRLSYELLRGPIPAGLTIDHLCRELTHHPRG